MVDGDAARLLGERAACATGIWSGNGDGGWMTNVFKARQAGAHRQEAVSACEGGGESHLAHLALTGECPWCGAYTLLLAAELGLAPWVLVR